MNKDDLVFLKMNLEAIKEADSYLKTLRYFAEQVANDDYEVFIDARVKGRAKHFKTAQSFFASMLDIPEEQECSGITLSIHTLNESTLLRVIDVISKDMISKREVAVQQLATLGINI